MVIRAIDLHDDSGEHVRGIMNNSTCSIVVLSQLTISGGSTGWPEGATAPPEIFLAPSLAPPLLYWCLPFGGQSGNSSI